MRKLELRVAALEAMDEPHATPRMIVLYPGRIPDAEIATLSRCDVEIARRANESWSDFTARAETMSPGPLTPWGAFARDGVGVTQKVEV